MAASTRATEPSRLKSTGRIWAAATRIGSAMGWRVRLRGKEKEYR
jgi:hypothetical protein